MPVYAEHDDDLFAESHYLSPHTPRRSPSRQSISLRKSSTSLNPPSSANPGASNEDAPANGGGRHHSLAHELAVALMPEPSVGSKMLAEEFGIEFDEGAEGIDGDEVPLHDRGHITDHERAAQSLSTHPDSRSSFANNPGPAQDLNYPSFTGDDHRADAVDEYPMSDHGSPSALTRRRQKTTEKDAMHILSENLEFTDKFLTHLRTLDTEPGPSSSQQPKLERLASDVIRRMNETVRDRESQVRVLLECEREFRKIGAEVGGSDVLGLLDELQSIDELSDKPTASNTARLDARSLSTVDEEPSSPAAPHHRVSHNYSNDWELDPERNHLGDADDESEPSTTPIRTSFPSPPIFTGTPTPAKLILQLTHIRSFTSATISSLTSISEHAQVNGVATADAGRKIRSLKNKLGNWKTEWESAERSRGRIERWEAGVVDGNSSDATSTLSSPVRLIGKRVDGRKLVDEQLRAFELALADAALKTQAIMAR